MTAAVLANEGGSRVRDRFLSRVARALEKRDLDRARALGESLVAKDPGSPEARFALALAALLADDLAGAAALAVEAFEADPNVRETADLAALVYGLAGDLTTAIYYGKLAAVIPASPRLAALLPPTLPTFARVLCEIAERPLLERGSRALATGAWVAAEHWLRQHLAFEPECREAQVKLALCLLTQGRARAATDALRAARHQRPTDAEIASLLGRALTASGRFADAAACHRHAISQAPEDAVVHAAALVDALADPACRPGDAAAGVRAWGRKFGERRMPGLPRPTSVAARRLVVGLFVAGNASSAEAKALTRILVHRDPNRFTMVGFGYGSLSENLNIGFQKAVDRWHDVGDCDPLTLAAMVEAEEIDILVDLPAFRRRICSLPSAAAWPRVRSRG
jgi:protein O-GlcNAc transferase